jgi:hypothetical protein
LWQRRAGFAELASDVDEDAGVAAVWLVRNVGSPESSERALLFERHAGWRFVGVGGSAQELLLTRRPSTVVNGPSNTMAYLSGCAIRSHADREANGGRVSAAHAGWVACVRFRLATQVECVKVGSG